MRFMIRPCQLALLLFSSDYVVGQVHVPLLGEPTRVWTSEKSGSFDAQCLDHWTTTYWIAGDSIIDGQSYSVIRNRTAFWKSPIVAMNCTTWVETNGPSLLVREEDMQVFVRVGPADERLIYDFTAEVGDTIPYPSNFPGNVIGWDFTYQDVVVGIDSIEVDGTFRKRWLFEEQQGGGQAVSIIAGIGGSAGPFEPLLSQLGLSQAVRLLCVREEGSVIYGEPFCMLITDVPEVKQPLFQSPHPNPSFGTVTLDTRIQSHQVISPTGQVVLQTMGSNAEMSILAPGIYFISGWDANGSLLGTWPVIVADTR